jgi:exosome complex exonuclease DIS3/RRP44
MANNMIDDEDDQSGLTKGIRGLMGIADKLRAKRVEDGALTLASPEVKFDMDEGKNPTDVMLYETMKTNYLVEEFMLLANISVARKIVSHYPSYAVLRKHDSPKVKEMEEFSKLLGKYGYSIHLESSKSLAESLDMARRANDPNFNKVIRILATRCMNQALYFCTADFEPSDFHHYGLAAPLYTHFTSPIRRYADVLVHRLLASALDLYSLPNNMTDKDKVSR